MRTPEKTIEYQLTASPFNWEIAAGKTIPAWGFNGQLPGPTLKAIVGDTLVIKVKNDLEEPITIHWHGIRLSSSMDGTGVVQDPIKPGQTFEYRFQVPDAGTFWYHSHYNETVQMERGLYGALIVEDPTDPVTDGEKIFMIDDMKLTAENNFSKPGWFLPRIRERHDGRQGNTLLINGKELPVIDLHAGCKERWRFINSSSARYFHLYMGGRPFQLIGTDGGLIEQPVTMEDILITPGERVDIIVGPFTEGESFSIESLKYNRTTFLKPAKEIFAKVEVGAAIASKALIPAKLREITPLADQSATVTRTIKFSVGPSLSNGMNFLINNRTHVDDKPVIAGTMQVWEIKNTSLMDHPFHLHGDFFQVLEVDGKAPEYRAWKDTVNLTPRSKIKIAWLPVNPGMWMYHCHILEHHEAGMMANFEVIDPNKILPGDGGVKNSGAQHAHHKHRH